MCGWGDTVLIKVKIPADLSGSGKVRWREKGIDRCIAPIVKALQEGGIDMRGSCCGHGKYLGDIHLQDGRMLLILSVEQADLYMAKVTKENPKGGLQALIEEVSK